MSFPITVSPSMPQSGLAGGTVQGRGPREGMTPVGLASAASHPKATHMWPCLFTGREIHSQGVRSNAPRTIHPKCLLRGLSPSQSHHLPHPRPSSQELPLPATQRCHCRSAPVPQRGAEWPHLRLCLRLQAVPLGVGSGGHSGGRVILEPVGGRPVPSTFLYVPLWTARLPCSLG